MPVNRNFAKLSENYFFSAIGRRAAEFEKAHPDVRLIRLSIGDVTLPLCPAVVEAMERAVREMGEAATFRGYGPEQGYPFLREAVAADYAGRGAALSPDEIFVSDGAKSDLGNFLDLFSPEASVLIPDPVYPVYVDAAAMGGHPIRYLDATEENGFLPPPPGFHADVVFLCSPNNPTGAAYGRDGLRAWVDYARRERAVLLFDAAYEAFAAAPGLPRSIFEIEGARRCAVEFCSLSKRAGFTGTRCGYTVVPEDLLVDGISLRAMWLRRQAAKFNGVPYIVQRGAEAAFTPEGRRQTAETIAYYRENAKLIRRGLEKMGIACAGGENAPYVWMRCPGGMTSARYFELLLEKAAVLGSPGEGFGRNGKHYLRLTAFGKRADVEEAMGRMAGLGLG